MANYSPLVLAALATVALPGKNPIAVRGVEIPGDYDGAELTFADNSKLIVQAPTTSIAGAEQAAELALLAELEIQSAAGALPFSVPEVVATTDLDGGGKAVVTKPAVGEPIDVSELRPGPGLAYNLGRALAALHELPSGLLERLEFPVFSAEDYRQRHLDELDAVGATGMVPPVLLTRWEENLDDDSIWQFEPVVLHGDLAPEYVLVDEGQVSTISGWSSARVADPADDLAWIIAAASEEAGDSVLKAYQGARSEVADPGLVARASLVSELALARWLQYGLREKLPDVVKDATDMLSELAAAVA